MFSFFRVLCQSIVLRLAQHNLSRKAIMAKKSNLLLDEYPLIVLPSLAEAVGLNEAIVLQQVHYWLQNPKGGVEVNGHKWVYNTYEEWKKDNFPFWSTRTIIRIFKGLEDKSLLISMQKAAYDRKKYYRIHYDNLSQSIMTTWHDGSGQTGNIEDDNMASSLTETLTENTIKKEEIIKGIQHYAINVFGNSFLKWNNFKKKLLSDDVELSGELPNVFVDVRGKWDKQFTYAEYWEDRYGKSFKNAGLNLTFRELE